MKRKCTFGWLPDYCGVLFHMPYFSANLYHVWRGSMSAFRKHEFPIVKIRAVWGYPEPRIGSGGNWEINETVIGFAFALMGLCFEFYFYNPKRAEKLRKAAA